MVGGRSDAAWASDGSDSGVELDVYSDPFFAGIVAARLCDAGVYAKMVDSRAGGRPSATRASVYVRKADLDDARRLLVQFAEDDGEGSPLAEPPPTEPGAVGRFLNRVLGGDRT